MASTHAVTPIFKTGKEDTWSYRPVSLTLILRKVVEQIFLETIFKPIKNRKGMRSSQHGFTKVKLCLTDLTAFYNEVTGG